MAKAKSSNVGKIVAAGAGAIALSAAAYLLFGPEGKKHRKDLKSWMIKMKAEVMEKMEEAQELTAPTYEAIVNEVSEKYKALKHVSADDLAKEASSLKKHWKMMAKDLKKKTTPKTKKK
jgi:gas vesicle protein